MRRILSIAAILVTVGWMVFGCGTASRSQKEPTQRKGGKEIAGVTGDTLSAADTVNALRQNDFTAPDTSAQVPSVDTTVPVDVPDSTGRDSTASAIDTANPTQTPHPEEPAGDPDVVADIPYEEDDDDASREGGAAALRQSGDETPEIPVPEEEDGSMGLGPEDAIALEPPATGAEQQPSAREGLFSMPRRSRAGQSAQVQDTMASDSTATQPAAAPSGGQQQETTRGRVYFTGDVMRSHNLTPDSSVTTLVNNVIMYHNGVVITCDSAVRYSDNYFECFRRVVINRGTTYIYGDRADYQGNINTATVYAPIVKLVDQDATLYTYRFSFNTLDKIARYGGGATLTQKDNMMESKRGYYYTESKEFIGVDSVQVRNPEYRMMSDSAFYNLNTETARFFTESVIWNDKNEILTAEKGQYHSPTAQYHFEDNAYIVTPIREIWADTLEYNSRTNDATLYNNIQFIDDEQSTMAFGDYGEYWGETEFGLLTRDPSLVSFDPQQPDTLYMRADSMLLYTFSTDIKFTTTQRPGSEQVDMPGFDEEEMITSPVRDENDMTEITRDIPGLGPDSPGMKGFGGITSPRADSLGAEIPSDSIPLIPGTGLDGVEEPPLDMETSGEETGGPALEDDGQPEEEPQREKTEKQLAKEEKRAEKEERRKKRQELRESIMNGSDPHDHSGHDHGHDHDGDVHPDSDTLHGADRADVSGGSQPNSTGTGPASTGITAPVAEGGAAMAADSIAEPQDSLQRVFIGLRDVRIYRNDFQAVCDSLVGFSVDSTMHMYVDPVLWSGANQISSDIIDMYTQNEELHKAEFFGSPFAAAEVEPERFNQIKGKFMEAWFRDNNIYKHDVLGNGECYYWVQDDATKDVTGFMTIVCADITFIINNNELDLIKFYTEPDAVIYPLDKIPGSQSLQLEGFAWHADRQPKTKEDVFDRVIRPSQRAQYTAIPEPTFPLSDRIIRHKESMIERGIWRERNDVLSPETIEYVNTVTNSNNR